MGMFDTIDVNVPLPELGNSHPNGWQTKMFHNMMSHYEITPEGKLTYRPGWLLSDPDNQPVSEIPYHGMLEFHNSFGGVAYRYEAKFTDGVLVEIVLKRKAPLGGLST